MGIPGGSAFNFARDIAEGFQVVTERSFKPLKNTEMDQLAAEIERSLRDIRAEQVPVDDMQQIQAKNRRISRLTGALSMMRVYRQKTKV